MPITRLIWLIFFINGLIMVAFGAIAVERWAVATAMPGFDTFCRGVWLLDIPISRAPLCFAQWVIDAKSWVQYAVDTLSAASRGLYAAEVLRSADVSFLVIGFATAGLAAAWVWADAMTRVTQVLTASLLALLSAVARARDAHTV
jgi:hypothetical protein